MMITVPFIYCLLATSQSFAQDATRDAPSDIGWAKPSAKAAETAAMATVAVKAQSLDPDRVAACAAGQVLTVGANGAFSCTGSIANASNAGYASSANYASNAGYASSANYANKAGTVPQTCRKVVGAQGVSGSVATCAGNERLVSGGGICIPTGDGPRGYLHHSAPGGNSWFADCYGFNGDLPVQAYAICCS